MKKRQILCAALIAAMAAVSCSRDEVMEQSENLVGGGGAIGFKTTVPVMSRANPVNSLTLFESNGTNFDVFAFGTDGTQHMGAKDDGVEIIYNGGWSYKESSEKTYWPDGHVSFFAVSPVTVSGLEKDFTSSAKQFTYVLPVAANEQVDLLVASVTSATAADRNGDATGTVATGAVQLTFKHALSQVGFKARTASDDYAVDIESITIANLKNTGTYTFKGTNDGTGAPGTWALSSETDDVAAYAATMADGVTGTDIQNTLTDLTSTRDVLLVLPQTTTRWNVKDELISDTKGAYLKISCRIKDLRVSGTTTYIHGSDAAYDDVYFPLTANWKAGNKYSYTLVFCSNGGSSGYDEEGNEIKAKVMIDLNVSDADEWQDATTTLGNLTMEDFEKVEILAANKTFVMGASETELANNTNQKEHYVQLTNSFYMSKYETTNAQYAQFLNANGIVGVPEGGNIVAKAFLDKTTYALATDGTENKEECILLYEFTNTPNSNGWGLVWNDAADEAANTAEGTGAWEVSNGLEDYPVTNVTWYGAKAFAAAVGGSLPTEAQWEFAARYDASTDAPANPKTVYGFGDNVTDLKDYAWYTENSASMTHRVGSLKVTPNGLYDMHGNVWEWCEDWYTATYYEECDEDDNSEDSPAVDPVNSVQGTAPDRVLRGGSWNSTAASCRSANRGYDAPAGNYSNSGFRVVFPLQ